MKNLWMVAVLLSGCTFTISPQRAPEVFTPAPGLPAAVSAQATAQPARAGDKVFINDEGRIVEDFSAIPLKQLTPQSVSLASETAQVYSYRNDAAAVSLIVPPRAHDFWQGFAVQGTFLPSSTPDTPANGAADYHGIAFDDQQQGTFDYHLDFGAQQGQGSVWLGETQVTLALTPGRFAEQPELPIAATPGPGVWLNGKAWSAHWQGRYSLAVLGQRGQNLAGGIQSDRVTGVKIAVLGERNAE